jgi:hypothetical protein
MLAVGVMNGTHFFLIGAKTATLISALYCVRIAIAYKFPKPYLSSIFVGIAAATTCAMWEGAISVLALTGTSLGTIGSFQKNTLKMRCFIIGAASLWTIHNVIVKSPLGIAGEVAVIGTHLVGMWRHERKKPEPAPQSEQA